MWGRGKEATGAGPLLLEDFPITATPSTVLGYPCLVQLTGPAKVSGPVPAAGGGGCTSLLLSFFFGLFRASAWKVLCAAVFKAKM